MPNVNDLTVAEAHRIHQHETIKDEIRGEVQSQISNQAAQPIEGEQQKATAIGQELREQAFYEVANTESEINRARGIARLSQVIDFLFYIVYSLIGLEILLDLMGARRGNAFRNLIDTLSAPFLAPFDSLLQSVGVGQFQLRLSYVFAFIVYTILHAGITSLLRMFVQRKTTI